MTSSLSGVVTIYTILLLLLTEQRPKSLTLLLTDPLFYILSLIQTLLQLVEVNPLSQKTVVYLFVITDKPSTFVQT